MAGPDSAGVAPLPIVVLISGRGSNLKAIIDAVNNEGLPADIRAVVTDRRQAAGLRHATTAGIPVETIDSSDYPDREQFDAAMMARIDDYAPGLVVLAGFMRILSPQFVRHYAGRLINIHPSLLPAFKGLNTHNRALQAGATEHGASVHLVTEELDGGPVVLQVAVPVLADDTPETLAARVLTQEHRLYPKAIRWFAEHRLTWDGNRVCLDGRPLDAPVRLTARPG
jgi:phosphoribosylglycinamide formyltransferase-1